MAEMGLFFESINGDRRYKVAELVAYLRPFFSDGVFPNPSTGLQVTESAEKDMFVLVKPGDGWINGRMYRIVDDAKRLRLDPSDSATTRIDRVVVGCNYKDRVISTYVKKGTPSTVATAPTLTRNATIYEISLAEITIAPGAIGITQSAIKDTRLDNSVCGIVTGLVNTVDTSTLYTQLEQWRLEFMKNKETQLAEWISNFQQNLNSWKNTQESDFTNWSTEQKRLFVEWFNSIKGQLNGDVAANLTVRVNELEQKVNTMELVASKVKFDDTTSKIGVTDVQKALEYVITEVKALKNEVTGEAAKLSNINKEFENEIGNPL